MLVKATKNILGMAKTSATFLISGIITTKKPRWITIDSRFKDDREASLSPCLKNQTLAASNKLLSSFIGQWASTTEKGGFMISFFHSDQPLFIPRTWRRDHLRWLLEIVTRLTQSPQSQTHILRNQHRRVPICHFPPWSALQTLCHF